MNQDQYLKILGLQRGAGREQIKKAYRRKARLYHPDLNKKDTATEIFIAVNEAYEYLIELENKRSSRYLSNEERIKAWNEYRREQARKRAYQQARKRYYEFKKSSNYKSSMILNKALLFITLGVGIFVCTMTVIGFIIELNTENVNDESSPVPGFLFLLSIGLIFILVSVSHIIVFYQNQKKSVLDEEKS